MLAYEKIRYHARREFRKIFIEANAKSAPTIFAKCFYEARGGRPRHEASTRELLSGANV